jgi:hypothetical protein
MRGLAEFLLIVLSWAPQGSLESGPRERLIEVAHSAATNQYKTDFLVALETIAAAQCAPDRS